MASLVQDSTASTSTASGTAYNVFSSNTTIGNGVLVAVCGQGGSAGDTVTALTSSIGTFVFIGRSNTFASLAIEFWYCASATGAGGNITVTWASGAAWTACAQEWSSAFSAAGSVNATTGTSTTPSASVTPAAGQLAVVGCCAGHQITANPTTPWVPDTASTYWNGGSSSPGAGLAHQIASSGSTLTASWSITPTSFSYDGLGAALTFASSLRPRPKGLPAAVRRANNYFKRESGLWEPERGFVVPRVA
jgi:hypothetical protein